MEREHVVRVALPLERLAGHGHLQAGQIVDRPARHVFAGNPFGIKQRELAGRRGNVQPRVQDVAWSIRRVHVEFDRRHFGKRRQGDEQQQRRLPEEPSTFGQHRDTMGKFSGEGNEKFSTGSIAKPESRPQLKKSASGVFCQQESDWTDMQKTEWRCLSSDAMCGNKRFRMGLGHLRVMENDGPISDVQSPLQRAVVFACLACFGSLTFIYWAARPAVELLEVRWAEFLVYAVIPIAVTF